jgi:hypothetical protein
MRESSSPAGGTRDHSRVVTIRHMRPALVLTLAALLLAAPAAAAQHKPKPPKHKRVTHSGTLVKRTAASVTVKRGDHTLTCLRSDSSPSVQGATVGDKVKVTCEHGVLVTFEKAFSGSATGTISALSTSSITLHNDDGTVMCTVSDGSPKLGDYRVGDRVKLSCSDGVLTAIARLDPPADVQTAVGTLTARNDASVTVHMDTRDLTCTRGDRSPSLGDLRIGDRVKIACTNGVLAAIAKLTETTITTGTLSAVSSTSVSVSSDGGERTCTRGADSPSLEGYHVGDRVKMTCTNGVLTGFAKADVITDGVGVLTVLSPTSLTVHTDGGDKTCSRTGSSPSLDGYQVGDTVKFYCTNGALSGIARVNVTLYATGVLLALSPTSLTVHTDGGDKTCSRSGDSPPLDGYQAGDRVKMACTNGVLTGIAKADTATTTATLTGVLSALSPTSLTVHTDGGDKTCSRTGDSPSLDGYQVGNYVKATCVNGVLTAVQHL